MKEELAVLAGYYGFGNAGDELILRSIIDQFRTREPRWSVIALSQNPEQTIRRFGVQSIGRWNLRQIIPALLRARRFVLGGGGLLQESTGPWNYAYYLFLVLLAKCLGCRTEVRGIGVDPVEHGINRLLCRLVLNHATDFISVRDADSQRALQVAGVTYPVYRAADPIFQLTPPQTQVLENRIALAITRWPRRVGWEHDLALLADRLAQQLHVLTDFVVFYPEQDEAICRKAAAATSHMVRVRIWEEPEDLLTCIGEYPLIIGMRYHALALAAIAGKPFIGWGFQRKIRSLCREMEQPVWSFERGWDSEAIFRQISEAWRQREILPQRYRARLPQLRQAIPVLNEAVRIYPVLV